MFLVFVSAILTTLLWMASLFGIKDADASSGYILAIAVILWLTCLVRPTLPRPSPKAAAKPRRTPWRASRKDVEAHKIPSAAEKETITAIPSHSFARATL